MISNFMHVIFVGKFNIREKLINGFVTSIHRLREWVLLQKIVSWSFERILWVFIFSTLFWFGKNGARRATAAGHASRLYRFHSRLFLLLGNFLGHLIILCSLGSGQGLILFQCFHSWRVLPFHDAFLLLASPHGLIHISVAVASIRLWKFLSLVFAQLG